MLRLPGHWVWDSWIADTGGEYHLFFLKAPRALGDPDRRHEAATIGHATSEDLTRWTIQPDALVPAATGWDDLALWTGSVVLGHDGVWRLFYTALSTAGHGTFDQRIGLVESADLRTWHRVRESPVLEADPRWYRTLDGRGPASETWRDPFVFADPGGDGWHMLVTAREKAGRGVLAHARSHDLREWELGPPVAGPSAFREVEVPQVRVVDGRPLLTFTCHPRQQSAARRAGGDYCTWTVLGESVTGPWDLTRARPFTAEPALFAAPLVCRRDGTWAYLGFRLPDFHVVDPIPVRLAGHALVAG
ncbi:glycosyl hydrolase family 32 [Amycolatopsis solani]|uniref:glycosyl hydrolase family 32 n=1 Tax=Amycolatopsis solani TaxID=3028615 RepID=UPI0025AF1C9A|nr:glycosyl hydrolase family 32 [Amycolatopsis sp. MEP2-6]